MRSDLTGWKLQAEDANAHFRSKVYYIWNNTWNLKSLLIKYSLILTNLFWKCNSYMLQPLKFQFKMKHECNNQEKTQRLALSNTCTKYLPSSSVTQEEKSDSKHTQVNRKIESYYLRQTMLKNNLQWSVCIYDS